MTGKYPKVHKIAITGSVTDESIEYEVFREGRAWKAKAVRLTEGRVMRAPESINQSPRVESVSLHASTYKALKKKCEDKFVSDTGDMAKSMDSEYVFRRVQDWKKRLEELYNFVRQQAQKKRLTTSASSKILMHEELMNRFFIEPTQLSTLQVEKEGKMLLLLKPKGLWIVGANGRVDLLTRSASYFAVDTGEYGKPSKWVLFDSKQVKRNLDAATISKVLNDERL